MRGGRNSFGSCPSTYFLQTPGKTEVVRHHISIKDPAPLLQPVYRVPERLLPVLKKKLGMMREIGVIEPSVSEWRSPIILLQRKDYGADGIPYYFWPFPVHSASIWPALGSCNISEDDGQAFEGQRVLYCSLPG